MSCVPWKWRLRNERPRGERGLDSRSFWSGQPDSNDSWGRPSVSYRKHYTLNRQKSLKTPGGHTYYTREDLDKHVPIAQTFDEKSNLAAQDKKMRTLVRDLRFIVPGHDPEVLKRFPKTTENVVKIE
jgi:hypothetical protein